MSGGSHNYICYRIEEDLCRKMYDYEMNDLIADIAEVAHDLEWFDSGDISEETYRKRVTAFKKKWFGQSRNIRLKGYIDTSIEELRQQMYDMIGVERKEE